MNRVNMEPTLLRWVSERSGKPFQYLHRQFPKLQDWE